MGPENWVDIAEDIEANYYKYDGFVICMGTDTMAYAASALVGPSQSLTCAFVCHAMADLTPLPPPPHLPGQSFMLESLGKPVVFTGSQIPIYEAYNDARRNLIISVSAPSNRSLSLMGAEVNASLLWPR
jgi:L-asparaginase